MLQPRDNHSDGCWTAGNLSYLLRPDGQTRFYDFVRQKVYGTRSIEPIVGNQHRRHGKSWVGVAMALERAIKRPSQFVKYGAGTDKDVEEIALPHLRELLSVMPPWIKYEKRRAEHRFWNPAWGVGDSHWSLFHLFGINADKGDRLRGRACDFAVLDEVRNAQNLRYVVEDVLVFQFVGRDDPGLVMFTTPPESMDHEFVSYFVPNAMQTGRYMRVNVNENRDFSDDDRRMVIQAIRGGEESIAWKREALCEFISDPERLITPEMSMPGVRDAVCVPRRERPSYFVPMTVIDGAYKRDKLAILLGYVDFRSRTLVIEDSFIGRELTTREIRSKILVMEHELGYDDTPHLIRRKGDLTPQQLADLNRDYKLRIGHVENKDPDSALSELRTLLSIHRIKILTERTTTKGEVVPVNQALIFQLENGVWNEKRSDYQRTEKMGHWDGGQGLAYFVRVAPWNENPLMNDQVYPANWYVGQQARTGHGLSAGMKKIAESLQAPISPFN